MDKTQFEKFEKRNNEMRDQQEKNTQAVKDSGMLVSESIEKQVASQEKNTDKIQKTNKDSFVTLAEKISGFKESFRKTFTDWFGTPGDLRQLFKKITKPVRNAVGAVGRGVKKGAETIFDVLKTGTLLLGGIFAFKKFVDGFRNFEELFGSGAGLDQKIVSGILNVAKGFLGLEDDTVKKLADSYNNFRNQIQDYIKVFEQEGFLGGALKLGEDAIKAMFSSFTSVAITVITAATFIKPLRKLLLLPFEMLGKSIKFKSPTVSTPGLTPTTGVDPTTGAPTKQKIKYNPALKRYQDQTGKMVAKNKIDPLKRFFARLAPRTLATSLIPILTNPAFLGAIAVGGIGYTIYDQFLKKDLERIKEDGLFGEKLKEREKEDKRLRETKLADQYDYKGLRDALANQLEKSRYNVDMQKEIMADFDANLRAGNRESAISIASQNQVNTQNFQNSYFGGGGTKPGLSAEYAN